MADTPRVTDDPLFLLAHMPLRPTPTTTPEDLARVATDATAEELASVKKRIMGILLADYWKPRTYLTLHRSLKRGRRRDLLPTALQALIDSGDVIVRDMKADQLEFRTYGASMRARLEASPQP